MTSIALALALGLAPGARAQEARIIAEPGRDIIVQPKLLNLNVVEALVAVGAQDLAGVFGFIPEEAAPSAFADYLLHRRKALRKFIKKGERDLKELGGISAWDKLVCLNLVQISGAGLLPPGMNRLDKKEEHRVSGLILARGLSLEEMTAIRGGRR